MAALTKRRIAILVHEKDNEHTLRSYFVTFLAKLWGEDRHEVIFLFGTKRFIPADLLIVHIDLSVVPEAYLDFARQYPVVVNGHICDIRKSTYSSGLLHRNADWDGPVIVKSDYNYAGLPERMRKARWRRTLRRLWEMTTGGHASLAASLATSNNYPIYNHLQDVPGHYFDKPGIVVQKFQPEMENGMYCTRFMFFLGDHVSCVRLKGNNPIVNARSSEIVEHIEPHPDIVALRHRLRFDYGKFDYVVVGGKAILLDANKTPGSPARLTTLDNPDTLNRYRSRAQGMYTFFREPQPLAGA